MTHTPDLHPDEQSATIPAQSAEIHSPSTQKLHATLSASPNPLSVASPDSPSPLEDETAPLDEDADQQTVRPDGKAVAQKSDAAWMSERHAPGEIVLPPGVDVLPEPDGPVLQMLNIGVTPEASALIAAAHPIVAIPNRKRVEAIANHQFLALHRLLGNPIEIAVIRNKKLARLVSTEAAKVFLKLLNARSTAERLSVALDLSRPEVWQLLFRREWNANLAANLLGVSVKTMNAAIAKQMAARERTLPTPTNAAQGNDA